VRFDNHWVSFTKNPDVIGRNYFGSKGLRGKVIILRSLAAVDITNTHPPQTTSDEEIVAPLSKNNLVEVLLFEKFIKKYGTGNSEYEQSERRKAK
jgi:hypothetical protein